MDVYLISISSSADCSDGAVDVLITINISSGLALFQFLLGVNDRSVLSPIAGALFFAKTIRNG